MWPTRRAFLRTREQCLAIDDNFCFCFGRGGWRRDILLFMKEALFSFKSTKVEPGA